MYNLQNITLLIAIPLSSSNILRVQLARVGSSLIVLILSLALLTVLEVDSSLSSAMSHVSTLDVVMQSCMPILALPIYLTIHKDLHLRNNVDRLRFKYDKTAIVYGIVCDSTNFIYVGSS